MKTKHLGLFALICAPFLFIDMLAGANYPQLSNTPFSGFAGLIYITGWIASMEGLRRVTDNGTTNFSWIIVRIVLLTLFIADISNVWAIFSQSRPPLFFVLDSCWPISNLLMLPVGWAVIKSGKINGWKKWTPLVMGFWFPVSMLLGKTDFAFYVGGLYSAIAWSLFAVTIMKIAETGSPSLERSHCELISV